MSGIKRFRGWLTLALVSTAAALGMPVGGAQATTGIEQTIPVQVTLTNHGVVFSRKFRATTDTTLELRITNRTAKARSFKIGNRAVRPLRQGESTLFYYSFFVAGKVPWHSVAVGGKHYKGS